MSFEPIIGLSANDRHRIAINVATWERVLAQEENNAPAYNIEKILSYSFGALAVIMLIGVISVQTWITYEQWQDQRAVIRHL